MPQFDYRHTGALSSAGPPVLAPCQVVADAPRPWVGIRTATPAALDGTGVRLDADDGEFLITITCAGDDGLGAQFAAVLQDHASVEVQYEVFERGHRLVIRDSASFGPLLATTLLFVDSLNAPLPSEIAADLRIERGPPVITEVLARPSGCTLAWDHLTVGAIAEERAVWLSPGQRAVLALNRSDRALEFVLHAGAASVGTPGDGCPRKDATAWSLIRREGAAAPIPSVR